MRFIKGHGRRRMEWVEEDRGYVTPCYIWQGTFTEMGYPTIFRDGNRTTAHRFLYIQNVGRVPDEYDLDHLCEVKACVNWTHLEPVTRSEHNFRTWARKRERAA
jgi:hypothetical protein